MALAPGWMLWAVDGGVSGGDVDPTQLDYFTRIGADLSPDVRVILTWPTPAWATGHRHGEAQVALDRFVIDTLGDPRRVALYLSGDSHHYAHLIDEQHGIHYVTAGGGGAFTHPTHTLQRRSDHHSPARATVPAGADGATGFDPAAGPVHLDGVPPGETAFALTDATGRFGPRTLRLGAVFPTFRQSRLALLRHLAFPLINPGFLVVTGAISAVFAMIAVFTVGAGRELLVGLDGLAGHLMTRYWANPLSWIPLLIVLVATTLFARAERADRASVFTAGGRFCPWAGAAGGHRRRARLGLVGRRAAGQPGQRTGPGVAARRDDLRAVARRRHRHGGGRRRRRRPGLGLAARRLPGRLQPGLRHARQRGVLSPAAHVLQAFSAHPGGALGRPDRLPGRPGGHPAAAPLECALGGRGHRRPPGDLRQRSAPDRGTVHVRSTVLSSAHNHNHTRPCPGPDRDGSQRPSSASTAATS